MYRWNERDESFEGLGIVFDNYESTANYSYITEFKINFTRGTVNQSSPVYNGWVLNHSAVIAAPLGRICARYTYRNYLTDEGIERNILFRWKEIKGSGSSLLLALAKIYVRLRSNKSGNKTTNFQQNEINIASGICSCYFVI